jgi:hypothetical protein
MTTGNGWAGWLPLAGGPRTITVPCVLEIERTADSFHAHAVPEGITLRPGDRVVVHGAPERVEFGQRGVMRSYATVTRAGPLERLRTRLAAVFELTELYHVGFEPKEASP